MKILFLDIDGVCNSRAFMVAQPKGGILGIDPIAAARVRRIIAATGCEVVLSSSWRLWDKSKAQVMEEVCEFMDITPDNRGTSDRGCEVIAWLDNHPEVSQHAILDDNSDFHGGQPLFKTTWEAGLTDEITEAVIAHLNKKVLT